jgi:hypothetical protein
METAAWRRSALRLLKAQPFGEADASLGLRLIHSQKATAVARATAERKLAASLS